MNEPSNKSLGYYLFDNTANSDSFYRGTPVVVNPKLNIKNVKAGDYFFIYNKHEALTEQLGSNVYNLIRLKSETEVDEKLWQVSQSKLMRVNWPIETKLIGVVAEAIRSKDFFFLNSSDKNHGLLGPLEFIGHPDQLPPIKEPKKKESKMGGPK